MALPAGPTLARDGGRPGLGPPPCRLRAGRDPRSRDEIVNKVSDFFGVTAEAAGGVIEQLPAKGRPTG